MKVEADFIIFPAAPDEDVRTGFINDILTFVNEVEQSPAFQAEKVFGKRFIKIADRQTVLPVKQAAEQFSSGTFDIVGKFGDDNLETDMQGSLSRQLVFR